MEEDLKECDEVRSGALNRTHFSESTLLVSLAPAERSFSSLRSLETWLRNNIGEERLNAVTLLHQHRHIVFDADTALNGFVKSGNPKLDIVVNDTTFVCVNSKISRLVFVLFGKSKKQFSVFILS